MIICIHDLFLLSASNNSIDDPVPIHVFVIHSTLIMITVWSTITSQIVIPPLTPRGESR